MSAGSTRVAASRRDQAFAERIEAGTGELTERLLAAYLAESGWRKGLRAVAYELRRFLLEDPTRAREMVLESALAEDRAREIREQGIARLTALIDLGRAEAADPDSLSPATAAVTAGAIYNRMHRGLEEGPENLTTEMVRELLYAAVLPYLGREAALEELRLPPPRD
jgi:hypothetical protein